MIPICLISIYSKLYRCASFKRQPKANSDSETESTLDLWRLSSWLCFWILVRLVDFNPSLHRRIRLAVWSSNSVPCTLMVKAIWSHSNDDIEVTQQPWLTDGQPETYQAEPIYRNRLLRIVNFSPAYWPPVSLAHFFVQGRTRVSFRIL